MADHTETEEQRRKEFGGLTANGWIILFAVIIFFKCIFLPWFKGPVLDYEVIERDVYPQRPNHQEVGILQLPDKEVSKTAKLKSVDLLLPKFATYP